MKTRLLNIIALTIAFFVIQPAQAEKNAASLEAHVHGLSELIIAMECENLEIEFISPAMNLVGFEHKALAKEDVGVVESTELQLRKHETNLLFSGGRCDHVKTSIDVSSLIENDEYAEHNNLTEHEHSDHAQNDSHRGIVANYQYRCDNKSSLTAITVNLFESFPGIHEIEVMWVKQSQQGAVILTPNNHMIEFR